MSPRRLAGVASLAAVILIGGLVWAIALTRPDPGNSSGGNNPLTRRDDFADKLDFFDTTDALSAGVVESATIVPSSAGARIILADTREKAYPRRGTWTSPSVDTAFDFTELIPSYNANTPPGTGVRLQVRVRDARTGEWSPWLFMGRWGKSSYARRDDRPVTSFPGGKVEIDVLTLRRPADAYQVRMALQDFNATPAAAPSVRRVAVVYSGVVRNPAQRAGYLAPSTAPSGRWDRILPVPFIGQGEAPKSISGEVCSPTCVTMVMKYFGVDRALTDNCMAIFDEDAGIFGNWNRAVQRAGELGMDAWLTRFRTWDQVKAQIAAGQPVIASIRFEKGVMPNNPIYQDTDGHLIVIRGFTPEGRVVVNDPASREKGNGVVYEAEELGAAWFGAGGVAYVIRPQRT